MSETSEKTETHAPRPDLGVPRYRLIHKTSGSSRFSPLPLAPGITYVGRVKGNDVVLDSELVSRRHAKIILTDMGVTVHDLDSHNGVFLNGKKVRSTPLGPGDLVYFGDVCCTLEPDDGAADASTAAPFEADMNQSSLISEASSPGTSDDPAVRSLATLIQATDLLLGAKDDAFYGEVLELCRALVGADLAVLVQREGDELATPVVLREAEAASGPPPVRWALVRKAIDDRVVFFSHEDDSALLAADAAQRAAVICVPVLSAGEARGALYFSRPDGARGFTDRDVETLCTVAYLVGTRAGKKRTPPEDMDTNISSVQVPLSDTSEEAARAELERLQSEAQELSRSLEDARAEAARAAEERDQLRTELAEAKTGAAALERERERLQEEAVASQKDGDEQLQGARADLAARAKELARLTEERDAALKDVSALKAELEAKTDEAASGAKALAELTEKLESAKAELAAAQTEAANARRERDKNDLELGTAKDEVKRLSAELSRHETLAADGRQRQEALQEALNAALPEALAARVLALAEGDSDSPLLVGDRTAMCVALGGFDAWAASASPTEVQDRLRFFCSTVRRLVLEHGGALEQILGHAHLALFDADQDGVLAAAKCACAIAKALSHESGVQVGLHTGSLVLGFFGEAERSVRAAVGEAVAVAKGAQEAGQVGAVMASEALRSKMPDSSGMMLVNCGPHIIRGMTTPMTLYQVVLAEGS